MIILETIFESDNEEDKDNQCTDDLFPKMKLFINKTIGSNMCLNPCTDSTM